MNRYRVCLSHVPGILAHANARTASLPSSLPLSVSVHTGRITGYLARGQDTLHVYAVLILVGKGMGGDTLGGLGDSYPCQYVPTILVTGLVGHGRLNPRNMVASRREKERQFKKSSACGVLTPAGTRRKKRRVVWDVGAGVDGWVLTNTNTDRPGFPRLALLVSSRLAVIVLFQLFPCHSLLVLASNRPRDPERPRASGTSQGFSQLGARGGLLVSRRRFHRAAGNIAATEPFFFPFLILLRPSPPGYPRPCSGDKVTRLSVLHANAELTRDLGPFGGDLSLSAGNNTTIPP